VTKRIVLAYSGGLDTSIAVKWLQLELGYDVITLSADVGQGDMEDADTLKERAAAAGAVESVVLDLRAEFADDFIAPIIKANALYEGKYPLVSALSRPLISRHLVAAAREYGAEAVAHGCTGKGNDQVRFEVSCRALEPGIEIVAPARVWGFTRADSVDYAAQHGIPVTASKEKPYSIDANLWGRAVECGAIEDPWAPPPKDVYEMTVPSAITPTEVVVSFDRGVPVGLDGEAMQLHSLVEQLNHVVGAYGFGRLDMVENRRVGIKSREVYESPAGLALLLAHQHLEDLCLERDLHHEKARLEGRYAELVYDGLWFSPLRRALDAFVDESQRCVSGEVRLELDTNSCVVVGRRSATSLYDYELATYDEKDAFRHQDAEGFTRIWGLGLQTVSRRQGLAD
jgi:argininosuccinate synthase